MSIRQEGGHHLHDILRQDISLDESGVEGVEYEYGLVLRRVREVRPVEAVGIVVALHCDSHMTILLFSPLSRVDIDDVHVKGVA